MSGGIIEQLPFTIDRHRIAGQIKRVAVPSNKRSPFAILQRTESIRNSDELGVAARNQLNGLLPL
jgi:hypothetical protein